MCLFRKRKNNTQPVFIDIGKSEVDRLQKMVDDLPKVTGNKSIAYGVNTEIKPVGICDNPIKLPYDTVSELLNNPIDRCIFCRGGKCYYVGKCERCKPLE